MKSTVWRVVLLALGIFLAVSGLVYLLFGLLKDAGAVDDELSRRDEAEAEQRIREEEREESDYGMQHIPPAPPQNNHAEKVQDVT